MKKKTDSSFKKIIRKLFLPVIFVASLGLFTNLCFGVFSDSFAVSSDTNVSLEIGALPVPPVPPVPPGGQPVDIVPPAIHSLFVEKITQNSADISWKTDKKALCKLFWGRTQEYKEEIMSGVEFLFEHSVKIKGLSPEKIYHFKVICRNVSGYESETKDQTFITLPSVVLPQNVSNLKAVPLDGQIRLTWKNPLDTDFKAVKIMRSEKFYPLNPSDGVMVYYGREEVFTDANLKNGARYYYTIFTHDKSGNYSSGAIVSAVPVSAEGPVIIPPPPPEELPIVFPTSPELEKITINDFNLYQDGKEIKLENVKPGKPLLLSINYEMVPEVLKTIMVTLGKDDKYFSFLLRINKEKTSYEAAILAPEPGNYAMSIIILDYKNQALKKITSFLRVVEEGIIPAEKEKPSIFKINIPTLILFIVLLVIIFVFTRRYYKKNFIKQKKIKPAR